MAAFETPAPGESIASLTARAGLLTRYAGAVVSLALVAGVGVWGYRLLIRDMTGVPVVRAMEGPVREAPSSPGVAVVPHLGLSVNDVAAVGQTAPPEERLLLAPVPPMLREEDMLAMPTAEADEPGLDQVAAETAAPEIQTLVAAIVASPGPVADPALLALPVPPDAAANLLQGAATGIAAAADPAQTLTAEQVLALADRIAAGAAPLADLAAGTDVPAVVSLDGVVPATVIDPVIPGVATALIPPARPATLAVTLAAAATAPVAAELAVAVAPTLTTDIPAGTTLVQLGAFETPEIAALEWDKLALRFADFMTAKAPVIQQATSGGRVFFRLRAMGYTDMDDARRFCAALAAEDAACIPVVVR